MNARNEIRSFATPIPLKAPARSDWRAAVAREAIKSARHKAAIELIAEKARRDGIPEMAMQA